MEGGRREIGREEREETSETKRKLLKPSGGKRLRRELKERKEGRKEGRKGERKE